MSTRRSLPPLRGTQPTRESTGDGGDAAPTRKKRRPPPKLDDEDKAPDEGPEAPKKRVPRKKKPPSNSENGREDVAQGDDVDDKSKPRRRAKKPTSSEGADGDGDTASPRKKRVRKKKPRESGEPNEEDNGIGDHDMSTDLLRELADIKDEVLQPNEAGDTLATLGGKQRPVAVVSGTMMQSQPSAYMYIEQKNGFKNLDRTKAVRQRVERTQKEQELQEEPPPPVGSSLVFAIKIHLVFKAMALIFQGLLAGISVLLLVHSYMEWNKRSEIVFVANYQPYAMGFQAMFFVLISISLVSSFSRHDIASPSKRMIKRAFTMQSAAVCIFFYLLAMVSNLANASVDDRMGLYQSNSTLWNNEADTRSMVTEWIILNTIRCASSILGFIAVCIKPEYDRFKKGLIKARDDIDSGEVLELEGLNN